MTNKACHRVALCLRELVADDQAWLLAQLTPEEVVLVRAALEDLAAGPLPDDADRVADTGCERTVEAAVHGDTADHAAMLDTAHAEEIAEILVHEPLSLIARLLTSRNWRWCKDYLTTLDPLRRARIGDCVSAAAAPVPHRAASELIRLVAESLTEMRRHRHGAPFTVQATIERLRYQSEEDVRAS